jgi:hypothetical protein
VVQSIAIRISITTNLSVYGPGNTPDCRRLDRLRALLPVVGEADLTGGALYLFVMLEIY